MQSSDSPTVHVVDPDEAIQDSVRTYLDSYGIDVQLYPDGRSFLRDALHDARGCVLVEGELPDMSGLALIDALRGIGNMVPVLFLTSSNEPELRRFAERRVSVRAIQKPLIGEGLLDALGMRPKPKY